MTDAGNESNLANESLANVIGMRNENPNFENIENSMSTDKKLNAFQPEENNCTSNVSLPLLTSVTTDDQGNQGQGNTSNLHRNNNSAVINEEAQQQKAEECPCYTKATNQFDNRAAQTSTDAPPKFYNKFVASVGSALNDLIQSSESRDKRPGLSSFDLEGIANYIKEESPKNVIFMVGAGISTSAGVPDFRSPGTGLYNNLQKFNLPNPHAIFEIGYFKKNPQPFFALAKELFHENIKPTLTHNFIRLFDNKGMLRRCYTQNIDMLEFAAGLRNDKIVTAHGSHQTSTCLSCKRKYEFEWMDERIKKPDLSVPRCERIGCKGIVKPDIVFFGESLPARFFASIVEDFPKCDLLIIMGTSLVVQPFASLITQVPSTTPRLLINKECAGTFELNFQNKERDVFWTGKCDEGSQKLANYLGWDTELKHLIETKNR